MFCNSAFMYVEQLCMYAPSFASRLEMNWILESRRKEPGLPDFLKPGLPDFAWSKHTKTAKNTK
jgi:hypothetical protein